MKLGETRTRWARTWAIGSWYAPIPPSRKLTQVTHAYESERLDSGPHRAFLQAAFALSSPPRTIQLSTFYLSSPLMLE